MEFYFQSNSVKNSLKFSMAESATYCLTQLFPTYQNKHWTIGRQEDHTVVPSYHRIILEIVGFLVNFENHPGESFTTILILLCINALGRHQENLFANVRICTFNSLHPLTLNLYSFFR
jgi:hypothetical protein